MRIIKETEEQLETHPQTELITKFLRTYYKEKYIEWFVENTEKSKIMIILFNYLALIYLNLHLLCNG